jgi:hypothetical protein
LAYRELAAALCAGLLASLLVGCSSLLPQSREVTASPWQTYQGAQEAFDKIIPGRTTVAELRQMSLDPGSNPNIAILNYADVMRKFLLNQSFSISDLDSGVRECVGAKIGCRGFEINQAMVHKQRVGNVVFDLLGFHRETHTAGWRFNGLILIKDDVVVYKLTGGQPVIHEIAEDRDVLGPLQKLSSKLKLDSINGIASGGGSNSTPSDPQVTQPITAIRKK